MTAAPAVASEFGGPWGTLGALVLLPALVYYLWISVEFHGGALPSPRSALIGEVLDRAWPTWKAFGIYVAWVGWQALLAIIGPGPRGQGALLPDGKSRLTYHYNGLFAWYATLALVAVLHWTGLFPLTELRASFGSLLTVTTLAATALALACYLSARARGFPDGATGNVLYDFFMGATLNPRIEGFDVKFFVELRPGIMLWFLFSLSMLAEQHARTGTVSTAMALMVFYHLCYANACYKGEECVPMSMDIATEKFGWMLAWGNLVWVPFVYSLSAYYLLVSSFDVRPPWAVLLLFLHLFGYFVFDTANSQKDYFRASDRRLRGAFPRLPWGRLRHPESLSTARGTALLVSGWWGLARHVNYTGDVLMAWTWGLTCGFGSLVPYVYPVTLTLLLLHRERRDERSCRAKYGADWEEYRRRVPHRFIPYVY